MTNLEWEITNGLTVLRGADDPDIANLNTAGSGSTIGVVFTGPTYLRIAGQVSICMQDGTVKFEPGYNPDAAARQFWEAMSEDYRKMLRWKEAHPEAQ